MKAKAIAALLCLAATELPEKTTYRTGTEQGERSQV